jgi:hypothetical protein
MLMDGDENKLRHSSRPSMILQPHTWTLGIVVFIVGDAQLNTTQ